MSSGYLTSHLRCIVMHLQYWNIFSRLAAVWQLPVVKILKGNCKKRNKQHCRCVMTFAHLLKKNKKNPPGFLLVSLLTVVSLEDVMMLPPLLMSFLSGQQGFHIMLLEVMFTFPPYSLSKQPGGHRSQTQTESGNTNTQTHTLDFSFYSFILS